MNNLNSNKKLLIFMSIFLLIISSFVVADLLANPPSFSFTGEPTETITGQSFVLTNDNLSQNITDLIFEFDADSGLPSNNVDINNFLGISLPPQIGNGSGIMESTLNFDFTMPSGLDAIDDNFNEVTWDVGEMKINGSKVNSFNTSDTSPVEVLMGVNVKIENHLEFFNNEIEFEISGEDPKNTSSGRTRTVQDGDSVTIRIFYENTFETEGLIFYKKDIEVNLYVDGERLDTQGGKGNADSEEVKEAVVEFDVEDLDPDTYPVEIELIGFVIDGNGGRHGEVFEFEIDVEEAVEESTFVGDSDGDGVNDDLDLCPNTSILCISDEAGCEMDPDNDGICNGVDRTPNGEVVEEQQISQNTISKQEESNEEPEEVEEKVVKKDNEGGGTGSFFFGLIVGFIGAALFFTLTKV
jgi:hypothetical protein